MKRFIALLVAGSLTLGLVLPAYSAPKKPKPQRHQLVRMESAYGGHRAAYRAWRGFRVLRTAQGRARLMSRVVQSSRGASSVIKRPFSRPRNLILRLVRHQRRR